MRAKKVVFSAVLLLLLSAHGRALADERVAFGQSLKVELDEEVNQAVAIGGSIEVLGKVKESAVAIGGSVKVSGEVGESVVALGGGVVLEPSARVGEDVVCLGGTIEKSPEARIEGNMVNLFPACMAALPLCFVKFLPGLLFGLGGLALPVLIFCRFFAILLGLALAVLIAALWPNQIIRTENYLKQNWGKALLVGLLVMICLPPFLIFLGISLFGIPLIPLVLVFFLAAAFFGKVAVSLLVGRRLFTAFGRKEVSVIAAVILGIILLGLVKLIPVLGMIVKAVVTALGWGAVLLTRFGTAEMPPKGE